MGKKILVADDEAAVQRTLARLLASQSYEVVCAKDGAGALAAAREQAPDLILLDVNMPVLSGWEVLRAVRAGARTRRIPVIMVTGLGALEQKLDGLAIGADDYMVKPFAAAELLARVNRILTRVDDDIHANPITRLPGSPALEAEVGRRIRENEPFAFLYADIDRFKSFNDAYGFAEGDKLILRTGELLSASAQEVCGEAGYPAHIGGDDFAAVCPPEHAAALAQRLALAFDAEAPSFYRAEDRARGFIEAKDRQGALRLHAIVTLRMGIATTRQRTLDHYAKAAQIASEMKAWLKAGPERRVSRFAFDRRRD